MKNKVCIIDGPNLNLLGIRPKDQYGEVTRKDIIKLLKKENKGEFHLVFFQSNSEGKLLDFIQKNLNAYSIMINPGAYTHTSIALHDCLEVYKGILIEVHLSDVKSREDYRKIDYIEPLAQKIFQGEKEKSYINALNYLKSLK